MRATVLWTLRQRRYRAMLLGMLALAAVCCVAGTWQVQRFEQNVRDNRVLRANAHAAPVTLSTALVPMVGSAPAPGRDAIRYRTVTVTGTYQPDRQQYLTGQAMSGVEGFAVVTPLQTPAGLLLVLRGFVGPGPDGHRPATVAAPPNGPVTIIGRLNTADTADDHAARLGRQELQTVNPIEQAARLQAPVYAASVTLSAGAPGTAGLSALAGPDLSNPAGGVVAGQHLAYIVQWYLFALLALAAPFAMGRHEVREARSRFLGLDPGERQFDERPDPSPPAALAPAGDPTTTATTTTLAPRARGELERHRQQAVLARGRRLADRYGRSFGPEPVEPELDDALSPRVGAAASLDPEPATRDSRTRPHRTGDDHHSAYNDYLWQLALADGDIPTGPTGPAAESGPTGEPDRRQIVELSTDDSP